MRVMVVRVGVVTLSALKRSALKRWSHAPFVNGQSDGSRVHDAKSSSECVLQSELPPQTGHGRTSETTRQSISIGAGAAVTKRFMGSPLSLRRHRRHPPESSRCRRKVTAVVHGTCQAVWRRGKVIICPDLHAQSQKRNVRHGQCCGPFARRGAHLRSSTCSASARHPHLRSPLRRRVA